MEYNSALLAATYSLSYGRCISSNKGLIRLRDPSGVQVSSASEPSPASILTSWGSLLICSTHRPPFSRKINDYNSYDLPLSAEHRHSRSRTSELIRRRLCRSNYVFVVHKLVATCYPSALDSRSLWHDLYRSALVDETGAGGSTAGTTVLLSLSS
ncbi:hypothetical protein HDV57DRAFT_433367 [Trichoderma longibrachiatum]